MISVAVRDVNLVFLFVDESLGRQSEIGDVIAALAAVGLADLHQELALLRELQDHVVVVSLPLLCGGFVRSASWGWRGLAPPSVAADPDVALEVDRNSVV